MIVYDQSVVLSKVVGRGVAETRRQRRRAYSDRIPRYSYKPADEDEQREYPAGPDLRPVKTPRASVVTQMNSPTKKRKDAERSRYYDLRRYTVSLIQVPC